MRRRPFRPSETHRAVVACPEPGPPPALGRAGEPDDIAETMLFRCAGAAYITGQTILVDGGR